MTIDEYAEHLDACAVEKRETEMFAKAKGIDISTAYTIQHKNVALRTGRGDARIGWKMGLTSKAKMEQMGVKSPICGALTQSMQIPDGGELAFKNFIHPKVEPEIVYRIGEDIPSGVSEADILKYTSGVAAGMEIIDSRFKDFKFTLPDVVADNCSSAGFVVSKDFADSSEIDADNLGMLLEFNGTVVQAGSSSAIFDHPKKSLHTLVKMLSKWDRTVRNGDIVLVGASTAAVLLKPGDAVSVRVQDLGEASFTVA